MKKYLFLLIIAGISLLCISCASNDASHYDEDYDYTEDESQYISDIIEPESNENFLANIDPVFLPSLFFLKKSGNKMKPVEIRKVAVVPRTNAVEWHFWDGVNQIAIILRKAERDKILSAAETFLKNYDEKTLEHKNVSRKTAYFNSKCSVWYGVLSPATGCERNDYYVTYEFINKKPYFLIRFVPTMSTDDDSSAYSPKISLYLSHSQLLDFVEQMSQDTLEQAIKENKDKAYTY